jgi:hypothetical protein
MHDGVTRRGVLQLFAALTAAVPVLTRRASAPLLPSDVPSPEKPAVELVVGPSRPTLLESYLRSRGVKPSTLARESGYARQHLVRIRMGRVEASGGCAVAITYALRRVTREAVVLTDLFPPAVVAAAWHDRRRIVSAFHPFVHRCVRAVFGRRS